MGDFYQTMVLDILEMLQLPSDVKGNMYGRSPDVKGRGNVTLQRVSYHQQFLRKDTQMFAELLEFHLGLVRGNLDMREVLHQSTTFQFVLLILQLAFGKDDETVWIGLQALQGLFYLWQGGSRQVEQQLTMAKQICQFWCREMIAAHTESSLDDTDGEGLAAIAKVSHIARLRLVEFLGRVVTVGCDELVEMVLYGFEVRLAVPEGVIGIEGNHS